MGSCCGKTTKDPNVPRCAQDAYPRDPAYANQPPALDTQYARIPPPSNMMNIGGGGAGDGLAMGYMMSQGGGMGAMANIDGGPRLAMW